MKTYLAGHSGGTSAAAPIRAKLSGVVLSKDDTQRLFYAYSKYAALDLSGCTGLTVWGHMSGGEAKTMSLALPNAVTEIANGSLAGFTSLKTLTASGVHTVGVSAFVNCTALETVKLPKAITVGYVAFSECTALRSVNLPAATAIGNYAFNGCTALETVNISGIAQVGQILTAVVSLSGNGSVSYQWVRGETDIPGATQATYTLTEADEGKTIRVRASRAGYAGSISSEPTAEITLPALTGTVSITGNAQVGQTLTAVASLGGSGSISYQWARGEADISGATQATYTLTEADEGKTIRVRASRAGCAGSISSAPTATVADEPVLAEFTSVEVLKTYLTGYSGGTNATAPIPLKLSGVALSTADMTSLFTALGTAGKYVSLDLSGCTGLTVWAKYTYAGVGKIVSLALPDSVMGLAAQCFIYFTSLKTLTVPGIQTVGNEAFSNCPALTSASLPAAAIIGDSAFYQCTALASASLPAAATIGNYAFSGTALASVNLPAATAIGERAFYQCTALTSASLPAAATIGNYAFSGTALASVNLPAATTIEQGAFYGCSALTSASLPAAATIGNYAFSGTALASVNLPAATTIGAYAFYQCTALTWANLPAATTLEYAAFRECSALTSIILPAATTLEYAAFRECSALTSIILPAATAIGYEAFYNCYALASLTLGTTLPTLGSHTFYNAGKDTAAGFTIYVPTSQAKTALDAAIADTGSNWYKALKTSNIGNGRLKGVVVP